MVANNCPFERAIQTVDFGCSQSRKTYIGEKEGVVCTNLDARQDCRQLVSVLKKNARFALRLSSHNTVLTHGQEMKLKCGGLLGLRQCLNIEDACDDIYTLINEAKKLFDDIPHFPYTDIMRVVADYKLRRSTNTPR